MAEPDQKTIGDFVDACVLDHAKAERLFRQHPDLREAGWFRGESILHFLAVEGQADAVRFLSRLGFDPNQPNDSGTPPLIDIAILGASAVAEALLDCGADPNAECPIYGRALHAAVRSGHSSIARLLLEAGASTRHTDVFGDGTFDTLPSDPNARAAIERLLSEFGISTPPSVDQGEDAS